MRIDWLKLREAARDAATRAYAPYSRLRVGAAGLVDDGRIVTGCNVENASYGLTLCAECGVVSALYAGATEHSRGVDVPPAPSNGTNGTSTPQVTATAPRLTAVAVVAGDGAPLVPCGRCRQLLLEAGGPHLLIDTPAGPQTLDQLLPAAFSDTDLEQRREA